MLDARQQNIDTLRTPEWFRSATRWTQLTFVENDPEKYDPAFWIDVFKRTKSNAVCLSAGGYIAFYPSRIPYHYVSNVLGDRDIFGALVDAARRLDMHVMARVDPHAIHDDAAKAHPEWVMINADGTPREHWAYPGIWITNAYGSYNTEFMPEVVKEIVRDYDIDAVFANRWQGHGVDYSEDSARRFKDMSGYDLPLKPDAEDPAWRAWLQWRRHVLTDIIVQWDDAVKAIRPHASFIPNMSGSSLMEFDLSVIRKHCPFLVVDHQGRRGVEIGWSAGRNGKRIRATFPDRPVVLITSIGPEEEYRWKDAVTTPEEMQLWMNNGTAHGLYAWFTKFNGVVPDKRWVEPVVDSFLLQAAVEPVINTMTPTAEVAVVDPSTTLRHWAPEERSMAERHDLGLYHALVEARIPFELVSDQVLTADHLDRFKVIVLANASCLSDEQIVAIRAYADRGGSVVAAYETSLRDENGILRSDFGLADVLGVNLVSGPRGIVKNTYVEISGDHPINDGYDGAERIMGGTRLIDVKPAAGTSTPFLYVPDFPDLPMEEVYPRKQADGAAVIARETGKGGRTVYIPWNIGEIFWEVLAADHGRLVSNAVRWALGKAQRVEVEGPGVVDIAVRESEDGLAISLLNLTNPMMMKGPVRDNIPLSKQKVAVEIPNGKTLHRAWLVVADRAAELSIENGRAIITVPEIERLEVLHLNWS
ncbi:family 10 glycosylhydrolase [Rhizobium sp. UGM030330-04]|uniref:family 10 glycosylhydrolase n=1 Tax=Rhizobium sp. UGM030330-04 TaxID=1378077 RepID=UPI000D9B7283|nr:family 10 glycosylhydrolase [Rhizobium sp. UGM030330-04]PYG61196.1 beta-galactosidase-like protein [Rhizobium sp. UGM030330-04]